MKKNFRTFIKELEKISNKYKIAINSIGGVFSIEKKCYYNCDYTSGDLICVQDFTKAFKYPMQNEISKKFQDFGDKLEKISNKYKIAINSIGGVNIFDKKIKKEIKYDCDYTSGDINFNLKDIKNKEINISIDTKG